MKLLGLNSSSCFASGRNILVVDDESLVIHYVGLLLASKGHSVFAAIKLWRTCVEIHLLPSDIQMPRVGGPGIARRLKTTQPDMRVLLMSAADPAEIVLAASFRFLAKPFTAQELYAAVASMLSKPPRGAEGISRRH